MGSGWIALYQFMKAKEQELKEHREQRERRLKRRLGRHRTGGQRLRYIKLTEEEKRRLRAKILEGQKTGHSSNL